MDKSLIQRKTKETLELVDKPKEFTKALQELLQALVCGYGSDKKLQKNYS